MNAASDVTHQRMSSIVTEGKDGFMYGRLLRARYDEKDIYCAHFHDYDHMIPDLTGQAISCTQKYQAMEGLNAMVMKFCYKDLIFALSSSLAYGNLTHFKVLQTP